MRVETGVTVLGSLYEWKKSSRSKEVDEIGHLGECGDVGINSPIADVNVRGRIWLRAGGEITAARVEHWFGCHI